MDTHLTSELVPEGVKDKKFLKSLKIHLYRKYKQPKGNFRNQ